MQHTEVVKDKVTQLKLSAEARPVKHLATVSDLKSPKVVASEWQWQ